jgi:exodeoxyribonuclease VII large subunit
MSQDILTVSDLNRRVKALLERNVPLLWVAGEVSNLTRAASGHIYFTLKDEAAQVRCVMFRSRAQALPWRLENGQEVEAQALVSLYEARGDFQLTIEGMRRGGLGRLFEAFARLKAKLEAEGLFHPERKRPLPVYPRAIGIVSSPQAAALHDILTALKRRAPHVPVILYPTQVQGEAAPAQIVAAINLAGRRCDVDVLIVARGGGSIEDLWAFNDEAVARAIADSPMPVVSGIGHETDFTIADFAADLRAATPTAAAELASSGWYAAADKLDQLGLKLRHLWQQRLNTLSQQVDLLARRLLHPAQRLNQSRQSLALLENRLTNAYRHNLRQRTAQLTTLAIRFAQAKPQPANQRGEIALLSQRLHSAMQQQQRQQQSRLNALNASLTALNPNATLHRGYSIVRDAQGQIISHSQQLALGQQVSLQLGEGKAGAVIDFLD